MENDRPITVDLWIDFTCPYCYVGRRALLRAAELSGLADRVHVREHSFELNPLLGKDADVPYFNLVKAKFELDDGRAADIAGAVDQMGRAVGLEFRWRQARTCRTFDAHRLLQMGVEVGRGDQVAETLQSAFFTEGRRLADWSVLRRCGVDAGLIYEDVGTMLESGRFSAAVHRDQTLGRALGLDQVPYFVFNGRCSISGARSPSVLAAILKESAGGSYHLVDKIQAVARGPKAIPDHKLGAS